MQRRIARRLSIASFAASGALVAGMLGAAPAMAADVTHTIAQVQGTGSATTLPSNADVTVEGVVTGDYRTGGFRGISLQTAGSGGQADATPGASDGVFVYLGSHIAAPGAVGDLVRVTGRPGEFGGQTQISVASPAAVELVQAGAGVPAATALPDTLLGGDREALESQLVAPAGEYRLISSHTLYSFGELWLNAGSALPVKSTEQVPAGAAADAIAAANKATRLVLDDGWSTRIDNAMHPNDQPWFTTDTVVRNGDGVAFGTPYVLGYGFNEWRLQPTIPLDSTTDDTLEPTFTPLNPRPATAPEVGGDIQVGSFNVFNYFTTTSDVNPNARGAENAAAFELQKSKIVSAIVALGADVVALQEIENSVKLGEPADEALADLVAGLNAAEGADVWSFVPTPAALLDGAITDFITNAIIYRNDAVSPVGASLTTVDETVWDIAREPIAQAFELPGGKVFSVIANHFKSKSPPQGGGAEPADGQGFFNAERVEQAQALVAFTETVATAAGSDKTFLIGDFNAYANEDPIEVFTGAGWTDLVPANTDDQYTYTFNGELGSLDHVIASPSVVADVDGVGVWGINSPEWSDRGYEYGAAEAGTPYRSSDHDPIVLGLAAEVAPVDISVVTTNDFHGRIETAAPSGGAAVLAGAVAQVRAANPNTVFAAAGDLIGASTFTSFIQQDNPTIDALNAAGLDVSAAGNHEFDAGWADLRDRVIPRANWEYISSNVYLKGTDETAMAPYYTETFDGVTIGFIGAVTEELDSLVSPAGIADLEVRGIVESVNAVAEALEDGDPANGEADVMVLLVHEGAPTTDLAAATDPNSVFGKIALGVDWDIDAIASAHTHLPYNHVVQEPGGDRTRPVFQTGQYGERFGLMQIQVDPVTTEILSITNELKPLMDGTTPLYPAVPEVQSIVDAAKAQADVLGKQKVGDITADFNRAQQPGVDANGNPTRVENRGGESTLGNFVADVQLWAAQQDGEAQIAFMNPGGLRADLKYASSAADDPAGNVTYREAAQVQPFANSLFTLTLTGAQVKQVLEEQWQPTGSSRPFLKLGVSAGLEVVTDATRAQGDRVTAITLDGVPIDPAGSYRVVVNSFLASGGDNFTTLASGTDRADSGRIDLQSMVDWFAANSTATPDLAQRSIGAKLTAPANGTAYAAGETIGLQLSSLDFSTTETPAGEVTVSLGDTVLGTAPVDRTDVPTTDEIGRAALDVVVPDGVSGPQVLTISVAATGTSVDLPITVEEAVEPEEPVGTFTFGLPNRFIASPNATIRYSGVVLADDGEAPVGTVSITDGGTEIATVEIDADDNGRFTVNLPKLTRGLHWLRANFDGDEPYEDSRSVRVPVLIW